uniref:Uncharacterized protein n=1 Tax=Amphimedon queenslandica TaxID=400682 RepID=A0A1X7TFL6_AMPQE
MADAEQGSTLKQTSKNCCTKSTKWFFPFCFFFFNCITCQWIRPKREGEKCCDYDNKCCEEEFKKARCCAMRSCNKCKGSVWIGGCYEKGYLFKKDYLFGCCQIYCGCFIMIISIAAVAINIFPLVMFIVGWATCREGTEYEISKLCYTLYFNITETKLPPLVLRNAEDNNVNNSDTKVAVQDFIDV